MKPSQRFDARAGVLVATVAAAVLGCQQPSEKRIPVEAAAIPPGQEELLGEMLKERGTLPGGCRFDGASIERVIIKARYRCNGGKAVALELRNADSASPGALGRTEHFVLLPSGDPPPAGLVDVLVSQIAPLEPGWRWKDLREEAPPPAEVRDEPRANAPSAASFAEACREASKRALGGIAIDERAPLPGGAAGSTHELQHAYECAAIAARSEAPCAHLGPEDRPGCLTRLRFFEAARADGAEPDWPTLIATAVHEHCADSRWSSCDEAREAIATQSPQRCPAGDSWCHALSVGGDAASCTDDDCRQASATMRLLMRGGLPLLARDGSDVDQAFAAAALGDAAACRPLTQKFVERCARGLPDSRGD